MGLLDYFGTTAATKTPTFRFGLDRDSTDLQIRSLLYLFKRLRINKLASFTEEGTLKYTDGKTRESSVPDDAHVAKLDHLYNLHGFEATLVDDEHRALVDWCKNKFRALCILSEPPSANLSRPLSPTKGSSGNDFENGLPVFKDYKDRKAVGFYFSILLVDTDIIVRDLANFLAHSSLYAEHHSYVSFSVRFQTAMDAIALVVGASDESAWVRLTEDLKAQLILDYLRNMAFTVQLIRIFKEHMKQDLHSKSAHTPDSSPTRLRSSRSVSQLPQLRLYASPALTPTLPLSSPKKASELPTRRPYGEENRKKPTVRLPRMKDESPKKEQRTLKPKASMSSLHIASSQAASPSSMRPGISPLMPSDQVDVNYGRELKPELWDKCRLSIRERISREKRAMKGV